MNKDANESKTNILQNRKLEKRIKICKIFQQLMLQILVQIEPTMGGEVDIPKSYICRKAIKT